MVKHASEFTQLAAELGEKGDVEQAEAAAREANKILRMQLESASEELDVLRQQMAKMGAADTPTSTSAAARAAAAEARTEAKMSGGDPDAAEVEAIQRRSSLDTLVRLNEDVRHLQDEGEAAKGAKMKAEAQAKDALRRMASLEQKVVVVVPVLPVGWHLGLAQR